MRNLTGWAFISVMLLIATLATATDVSGRVTVRGGPLAGAVVTANLIGAQGPEAVIVTQTGPNGEYVLRGLPDGEYVLLVDLHGRRIFQGRISLSGTPVVRNVSL